MIGQLIADRYQLEEQLGIGGMAQVYKANDVLLNRTVTVKILKQEFSGDEEFIENFNHEAKSAASLNHPNVVSVYDVGEEDGLHYIVMEYVDGIDVQELIDKNGPIAWQYAVDIYLQVGLAIENAHQHNLIHRDIKPKNILLTREGKIKVTDFGIAIAMNSSTINLSTTNMGSVHYFSPEQAQGRPVDERSDIYSMGISMYETLTGRVPFDGENPVSIALMHIKETPVAPIHLNDQIPQGLNDIVMKCVEKNPKNRYQSVGELLDDIRAIMDDPAYDIAFVPTEAPKEDEKQKKKTKLDKKKDEDDEQTYHGSAFISNLTKILIALTILLALGTSVYYMVTEIIIPLIKTAPKEVYTVQDFVGKNYEEVVEQLNDIGIFTEPTYEYSTQVAEGYIIRQETPVGEVITRNTHLVRVKLVVSRGPQYVTIPENLLGKDKREVENTLMSMGLKVVFEDAYSNDVAIGYVSGTYPELGGPAIYGTTVTVYVSKGPATQQVEIPDLSGYSQRSAYTELIKLGLKVGYVGPNVEDYVDYTAVVDYTTPAAGTLVDAGTSVDIYLKLIKNEKTEDLPTEDQKTEDVTTSDDPKPDWTKYFKQSRNYHIVYSGSYGSASGINVKIVAVVPGDTTEYVLVNTNYRFSEFPIDITVDVPFALEGETFVTVYLDGQYSSDYGETYNKVVPECLGMSVSEVTELLQKLGAKVEIQYDYSDTYDVDKIAKVYPDVGTEITEGDTVVVTVSLGKQLMVPDLSGMTYEQAIQAIKDAGLTVGNITKNSDGAFYTTVATQSPEAFSGVAAGAPVNIVFNAINTETLSYTIHLEQPAGALTTETINVQIFATTADSVISQEIYSAKLMAYQLGNDVVLVVPVTTGNTIIAVCYNGSLVKTEVVEYVPPVVTPDVTEDVTADVTEGQETEDVTTSPEENPDSSQGTEVSEV